MTIRRFVAVTFLGAACAIPALPHDGKPDRPAKHGGIVFTSGPLDVEVVLKTPKGPFQVFFNDPTGEDMPASVANNVALELKHGGPKAEAVPLRIDDSGESWVGAASSTDAAITSAQLTYRARNKIEQTEIPFNSVFHAEFQTLPKLPKAGEPVQLIFAIKDYFGRNVPTLQIEHEKPIHLMVVSRDMADFDHIHPELSTGKVFRVPHTFPHGGDYRLFADYTPIGAGNRIESFDLKVAGPTRPNISLVPTTSMTTTLSGIRMTVTTDKPLQTGVDVGFAMSLFDATTGTPIHNVQPWLGAWAHLAVISEDTQNFIHVHPIENVPSGVGPSPGVIHTATGFRRAGTYKMWVQVQRASKVISVPFVYRVASGQSSGAIPQAPAAPNNAVLVSVSSSGFEPSRIPAKAGTPLKLAFHRVDAQNCARQVVFPSLGIQRDLPPGQTVLVDVTPARTGDLTFSCGMKMMRGDLIVQ